VIHFFSDLQNGSDVPASITIVGCGPNRDQPVTKHHFVALHDQLVGPGHHGQTVNVLELFDNVGTENVSGTSGTDPPPGGVFRVGPQQITDGSLVGDFSAGIQFPNLVQSVNTRRQASVDGKNLLVDDGRQRQTIKDVRTVFPNIDAPVFAQAFVVKAVNLGDLSRLVVAPDQKDPFGVADLEGQK